MVTPIRMERQSTFANMPLHVKPNLLTAVLFPDELVMVFLLLLCYKGTPRVYMVSILIYRISNIFKHYHIYSEKDFEPPRSHFSKVSIND